MWGSSIQRWGTKKQPKEKLFGPDIPRTSRSHPCGRPGSKTSGRPSKQNKHLGADMHDPNARTSMTPSWCKQKSFGLKSLSLKDQRYWNDTFNKICVLEGRGGGKLRANWPEMLFFLGNSMTIKFWNFANFIVTTIVLISEAPKRGGDWKAVSLPWGTEKTLFGQDVPRTSYTPGALSQKSHITLDPDTCGKHRDSLRKLEQAVAVFAVCSRVPKENSERFPEI